jgi:hypothetical protein
MLYVYGVVRASHPGVTVTGVQGTEVRLVRQGDLAAVVADLPDDDELLARRRDVTAYLTVLEAAAAAGDVLPFRFGTTVVDGPELCAVLDQRQQEYKDLLDQLSGLVQVTVKAVRDDDDAVRTVLAENPSLRRYASRMSGSVAMSDRIALGERMAAAVAAMSERDVEQMTARLVPPARRGLTEDAVAPTVLSLALLVEPEALPHLDEAVASLVDDYGHRYQFDYAGPMPPYSFVTG